MSRNLLYNYWEKGERIPSIEAAAKIADFFNITIESLLDSKKAQRVTE